MPTKKRIAAGTSAAKKAGARAATGRSSAREGSAPRTTTATRPSAKPKAAPTAERKAVAKKVAPKKAAARRATVKDGARKPGGRRGATKSAGAGGPAASRRRQAEEPAARPAAIPGLGEEEQIRAAKYLPRELPKRLFEEERFLFPETYGVDRVRLLVRDPEWIFAYWDVSSGSMKSLARRLGERAFALSRLTLRVVDPVSGGQSDILLPPGARWWYIRTDAARRTYRAEIGVTLPSGEFQPLAGSNTVVTPRVGPSRERATRRLSYREAVNLAAADAEAAGRADRAAGLAAQPWKGERTEGAGGERGGASESFRPAAPGAAGPGGASDAFRPGASDTHRR